MEVFGGFVEGLIQPLLLWIREDSAGPALAGVIVIAGLIIIARALRDFYRDHSLVSRARRIVAERSSDSFARDFNTIDQDMENIPKIKDAWNEFTETLIRPKFDEEKNLISPCENTARPQVFFNLRELEMGPNLVLIFPGVFVGVGLSLTFLGLISALGEAVGAINASAGETTSIQTAIGNLLKISSAKFYASLFALFMSVVMTVTLKTMTRKLQANIASLSRAIETGVRFLPPAKLSIDANEILKSQLSQLQTFNTDLAMKVGEQVQSSLKESLAPVIQRLDDMSGDMTQQNIQAIKDISLEVTNGIQDATAGSMEKVAETLDDISFKLGSLSDTLGDALSNFDTDFRKILEGLKTALSESAEGVAEGIGASVTQMSEGVGKTTTEITEIIDGLTSTVQSMASASAEISQQSGEELRKQVQAASEIASEQMAQAGRELSSGFQESTEGLVNALGATTSQVRQLEQGLIGLPQRLSDVNAELGTSSAAISESAQQFGTATSGLRSLVEPLAEHAAETRRSIDQITDTMQTTASKVSDASASISDAVNKLDKEISAQLSRLDGSDEKLAELFQAIEQSTSKIVNELDEYVTKVDNGFSLSIGALNSSVSELEETFDRLRQSIDDARAG